MEASEIRKKVVELGLEIREQYCSQTRRSSLMFPPAPQSKFPDKFPEVFETNKEQKEYYQQVQYEGEVKLYRILENMNIGIVLHGFRLTHKMVNLYVRNHSDKCKLNDRQEEGECDFLVIFKDFLAIFEVKVPDFENSSNPDKAFERNYKDSKHQRKRTKDLIYGICKRVNISAQSLRVLDFTVFIEADENLVSKFQSFEKLPAEEKRFILFKNCDKQKLSEVFVEQSLLLNEENEVHEKMSTTLLGLWCYNDVDDTKKSENVELSDTIARLNEQLRISKISRVQPKRKPASSCIVIAPKTLQKLGINFITKDQLSVLKNEKRKLWINGPAGSGKTLMMLGKIIQLLEDNPSEKVTVVVLNKIVAKDYKKQLEKADICSVIYDHVNDAIFEVETKSRVFIVYFKVVVIDRKLMIDECYRLQSISTIVNTDHHIFVDDFHGLTAGIGFIKTKEISGIIFTELQSPSRRLFWVTYDILQDGFLNQHVRSSFRMREVVENVTDESCFISLPAVLRNCRQIADLLSSLRELRLENEKAVLAKVKDIQSSSFILEKLPSEGDFQKFYRLLSLRQEVGHFIHGPKPILYTLISYWSNKTAVLKKTHEILNEQLKKLASLPVSIVVSRNVSVKQDNVFSAPFSRGISTSSWRKEPMDDIDWKNECEEHIKVGLNDSQDNPLSDDISINYFDETFSAEWPAVIGIIEFSKEMFTSNNWISTNDVHSMSNSDSMIDQLLSKIYITVSRARVYCCLILIMRDIETYPHTKMKNAKFEKSRSGPVLMSDIWRDCVDEVKDELNEKLLYPLNEKMTVSGQFMCKCKNSIEMSVHVGKYK